jgi:hypothetical protein
MNFLKGSAFYAEVFSSLFDGEFYSLSVGAIR